MAFSRARRAVNRLLRRNCFNPRSLANTSGPPPSIERPASNPDEPLLTSEEFLQTFRDKQERTRHTLNRLSCSNQPVFLPEHQLTVRRRRALDLAVPKELQESQVSTDLHMLSSSDEAGNLPYCEDVANRNVYRRSTGSGRAVKPFAVLGLNPPNQDASVHSQGIAQSERARVRRGTRRNTVHVDRPASRLSHYRHEGRPLQATEPNSVYLPPLRKDGRRQSLSRKANVHDLRVASGSDHTTHSTGQSRSSASVERVPNAPANDRPRIDKLLPPTPGEWISGSYHDHEQSSEAPSLQPNSRRLSAPQMIEKTTYSEQWMPAVTHETIHRDVHTILEDQIQKEIHQYHIHRRIQPIVEYEILPARHFVHLDGGGYTEISAEDLPNGVPSDEWFAEELRSQLQSSEGGQLGTLAKEDAKRRVDDDARMQQDYSYTENTLVESPIYEAAEWNAGPIQRPVFTCNKIGDVFDLEAQCGMMKREEQA